MLNLLSTYWSMHQSPKAPFELVYGTNVQTVVDQLDGVHYVENA